MLYLLSARYQESVPRVDTKLVALHPNFKIVGANLEEVWRKWVYYCCY